MGLFGFCTVWDLRKECRMGRGTSYHCFVVRSLASSDTYVDYLQEGCLSFLQNKRMITLTQHVPGGDKQKSKYEEAGTSFLKTYLGTTSGPGVIGLF